MVRAIRSARAPVERRHMTDPARHDRAVDLHPAAPVNVRGLAMQR